MAVNTNSKKTHRSKKDLEYFYHSLNQMLKNGKFTAVEEKIIKGDRGISFKYYKKVDKKIEKYSARQNTDGTFTYTTIIGEKKDTKTLSRL